MDVKTQHYVPRSYLVNFADPDGKVWVFDKFTKDKFRTGIDNVAAENRFYDSEMLKAVTGDKQFVEKKLSGLEGDYAAALKALLQSLESGRYNGVSKHLRHFFSVYMIVQMIRTKEYRIMMREMGELNDKFIYHGREEAGTTIIGETGPRTEAELEEDARESQIRSLLDGDAIRYQAGMLNNHIWIIQKAYKDEVFYTSDNPFGKRPHGQIPGSWRSMNGISSKGIEIVFPLTSRYHLTLYEATHFPAAKLFEKRIIPFDCTDNMIYANQFQVTRTTRFVFSRTDDFSLAETILADEPHWGDKNRKRVSSSWDEKLGR